MMCLMTKIIIDDQKIKRILENGVSEVIEKESLEKKLKSGKILRIKLGADPSRPDLHLGHTVVLKKLKEFQDLGHKIIFIIGDYTGMIGDPSGKSASRNQLSLKEVSVNAKTYLKQVGKVLDIKKTEIRYNGEWFRNMKFSEIINLTSKFTAQRILERDDFEKRFKEGVPIGAHELLYPIMQAYDSVVIKADVELGGTDQKFNMLAGRRLQEKMNLPPQDVITTPLLVGLDGKNKMSKSLDNYIGIVESSENMFGKIMSLSDNLIINYFELLTGFTDSEILEIKNKMASGENPRDLKILLAEEIVKIYHNDKSAQKAKDNFIKVFSKREIPEDAEEIIFAVDKNIIEELANSKITESKGKARRLVAGGGIKINGEKIEFDFEITKEIDGKILQVGKMRFYKIRILEK